MSVVTIYYILKALELNIFQKYKKIIKIYITITNVYRIQANDSIMWEYFCIGFIDFMLKGKCFLDYKNVFSPNDYEKNDKIILNYFQ